MKKSISTDSFLIIYLAIVAIIIIGCTLMPVETIPTLTPLVERGASPSPAGSLTEALVQSPSQTVTQPLEQSSPPQPAQSPTLAGGWPGVVQDLGHIGTYPQNSKIEITLEGPVSDGNNQTANPFKIEVDVTFSGPGGQEFRVPAFFDGDGSGGLQGNVWKVRFRPETPGSWNFVSSSQEVQLTGYGGQFEVAPLVKDVSDPQGPADDFSILGTLRYTDEYYLRFNNGDYWIKSGVDDPENFLGKAIGDWNAKKAAVDYLSSKGINSIYIITNNIDGDRKDTWPWVGKTQEEAKANSDTFDVAKLQLWEDIFTYIQDKGIVMHIVLADDSAWHDFNHELYYREMVARFGHHPGIIWNIGEEANEIYSNQEQIGLAGMLQGLDPYDHPVAVHRLPFWPFFGNKNFDAASIQPVEGGKDFTTTELGDQNHVVIAHRERAAEEKRPIPIMIDELPRVTEVTEATRLKMRSEVLYPIYFGGGNFELHFYDIFGEGGSVSFQDLAPMLDDMRLVREFLETLPFNSMAPCEGMVSGADSYCFGKPGEIYSIYLPGGGSVEVYLPGGETKYNVFWFDPRTGEKHSKGSVMGGLRSFSAPDAQDWVLLLHSPTGAPGGGLTCFLPFISSIRY
jgi:hypothetical protein